MECALTMQVNNNLVQSPLTNPKQVCAFANLLDLGLEFVLPAPRIVGTPRRARVMLELPNIERGDEISERTVEKNTLLALRLA